MEILSGCAAQLVAIAAVSALCEHFLRPGQGEKGLQTLAGLLAVYAIADAVAGLLGR